MMEPGSRRPKRMRGTDTSFCLKWVYDTPEVLSPSMVGFLDDDEEEESGA